MNEPSSYFGYGVHTIVRTAALGNTRCLQSEGQHVACQRVDEAAAGHFKPSCCRRAMVKHARSCLKPSPRYRRRTKAGRRCAKGTTTLRLLSRSTPSFLWSTCPQTRGTQAETPCPAAVNRDTNDGLPTCIGGKPMTFLGTDSPRADLTGVYLRAWEGCHLKHKHRLVQILRGSSTPRHRSGTGACVSWSSIHRSSSVNGTVAVVNMRPVIERYFSSRARALSRLLDTHKCR